MNKVVLCGRLTKDPEIRQSGEMFIAKYSLAVDRKVSKGEEKQTDFLNCVCFGKTAEFAEKYLHKGMKMLIFGRIITGSYTNKDNVKVNTFEIIVEEHEFCESKNNNETAGNGEGGFMEIGDNSNLPF